MHVDTRTACNGQAMSKISESSSVFAIRRAATQLGGGEGWWVGIDTAPQAPVARIGQKVSRSIVRFCWAVVRFLACLWSTRLGDRVDIFARFMIIYVA